MGKDFTSASKDNNVYIPYSMTEQLFEHEKFYYDKTVLEPCCGEEHIVCILANKFKRHFWYDIKESENNNFLYEYDKYNYIITNPPYSKLDKFIVKAKEIATDKFAFLCKLTHLGGVERFNSGIFKDKNYPLTKIYLFTRQANLRFTTDEEEKKGYIKYREIREDGKYPAGMYYYCWLIWEKYNRINYWHDPDQLPSFHWIDNSKYILRKKDIE